MIIAIDFDGTIVEHMYPNIGAPVPGAIDTMKLLQEQGHKIILWTMRSGRPLEEAVEYVTSQGIELFGINENPEQYTWSDSPKAYAQMYIDDAAIGCPMVKQVGVERAYVDWGRVSAALKWNGVLKG